MSTIQFGFILPSEGRDKQNRPTLVKDMNNALDLITGHFDSAWMIDHLQFGDTDVLEGFTVLTYLSALHPQLKFGTSVLCQSFRNPALLAKMTATLQFMSEGRFILGLGAGWHEEEYKSYGYEFPAAAVRVEQLEEAVQIIQKMWREKTVTFEGQHYRVIEARCEPRPVPLPPIMVGAFKPKMLRLTAKYADWWNVSSTSLSSYRRMVERLEKYCLELGRDPSTIRRTWAGGCVCAPSQEEAAALVEDRGSADDDEDSDFFGTPEQLIEQMRPFIELGVDYFMLDCGGFPKLTTLEMLIDEVLPALREFGVGDREGADEDTV
jgi:alkanesulfonate monooxygenase SsuD/methylene tetrahydromethanopterin reductase-like flavin-dependent oxidoreductase (luciferase family)